MAGLLRLKKYDCSLFKVPFKKGRKNTKNFS